MKKLFHLIIVCTILMQAAPCYTLAKRKKSKNKDIATLSLLKKDSTNKDLEKVKKDATVLRGMFTLYFNEKTGKLYFSLPEEAFTKSYLLSSRISATSDGQDYVAGEMHARPFMISFSTDERNVYMHKTQNLNVVTGNDPMSSAFGRNNMDPVLKGFKIVAKDNNERIIDVTAFFGANEKSISPIKESNPISKLLGGSSGLKGTFQPEASGICMANSFEKNIEIKTLLSYQVTGVLPKPYSVVVHRSLFALPDEPMKMRLQDNRVGYFSTEKNEYTTNADEIRMKSYINRWRIEPKTEDLEKYFAGELVEPKQQIIFYVDNAFPEKWRGTIKEGIEVWNQAFEKAGFKNVIKALDYPENDSLFNPDDIRFNCFRYVATNTANAMGPSYTDPRTGEILAADVIWYHNIVSLLHNWRFVQTGAVDPRVRTRVFDDDLMRESIRYAASHEIGHTLGLMHNMGASYSYPVDSLRSPSFTQKYGTTPSIMDYARNNYVAQPGDLERGVKMTPPALGVYDLHAINWGYRLIKDAKTPEEEKATLDSWIKEKNNDQMFEFGAQQLFSTIDPTDQTEDLGDDHIKAGDYGISNLKVIMSNFDKWLQEDGQRFDNIDNTYREILKQYARYVKHVLPYIGGIRYKEIVQGESQPKAKNYIDKVKQKEAMNWLLNEMRTCDSWLVPKHLMEKIELDLDVNQKLRTQVISGMLGSAVLYRIKEGGIMDSKTNYTLDGYLNDFTNALFISPTGGKLSEQEQQIQSAAINYMITNSGLVTKATTTSTSTSSLAFEEEKEHLCGYCRDFARINLGVSALSKTQLNALMTGRLNNILKKYKSYRNISTGSTRDYYDYHIVVIERALSNQQ